MKLVGHMGLVFGNSLGGVRRNFQGFSRFEVDNGSKVRFWHDVWCREQPP
jgi:hypothetical protein